MFALLLLFCICLLVGYLLNLYTYWERQGVPHETPIPLLGNFKGIGSKYHVRDINQRLYRRFKGKAPFAGVYMFVRRAALVIDLNLIKNIMVKDFANFHDRGGLSNVEDDPLTGHLVSLEGEQWRAMRTKLTPVFTSARMKYMFPTVVKVGENFARTVGEMLEEGSGTQILEIRDLCARFTTDVIGNCAFGIECNSLKDPNSEFRLKGKEIFSRPRNGPLLHLFAITNDKLASKFHMKILPDDITEFFMSLVRQTVEYRVKNEVKCNDFMDLLIEMRAKDEELARASKGIDLSHGLTLEQMGAQAFVFFFAGFETSSITMTFALYELARHQEVQDRLRKEILESLRENKGELTYEAINNMEYLDRVVAETLRFYPPLATVVRVTKNDYQIPNTRYVIKKDIMTIIPIHAIHHDPQYYAEPERFNPDRFTPEECLKRHPSAYLPFGDGPRNCIGLRFGKMQVKVGLVSLLSHYRFEFCPLTEQPLQFNNHHMMVAPKNGVYLKVTPV
ncbi:probable cytochrome P450 6a14 [Musca domestica]|uniref:Cytochrome P450 n=1 Tax=Musca domestica TaxID=7370 RepID=Q27692_MUSDO|nr:probable cytochrome P450 6a14 [Musca domestica]AAA69817.1 cytochrome P450 [Musca domestica]